jgi:hypothetical protein
MVYRKAEDQPQLIAKGTPRGNYNFLAQAWQAANEGARARVDCVGRAERPSVSPFALEFTQRIELLDQKARRAHTESYLPLRQGAFGSLSALLEGGHEQTGRKGP